MNDTPTAASPNYSVFVAFHFRGTDNGLPKEGFDSRVIQIPGDTQLVSAGDLKEVADALANSEFKGDKRYTGLEITIINLVRLPV